MTVIQLRRGTAAEWTSRNPVLAAGEVGLETDTAKIKAGTGTATWNNLPYIFGSSGAGASTVNHGAVSSAPRPAWYGSVIWIGSVQPVNSVNGDIWIDTSGTAPAIATTTLGSLNVGAITSQFLVATGTVPLVWSVTAGALPAGLALSTAGNLFGVPTATGSYSFTVTAQNPFGVSTKTYSGTVGAALAPTITTTSLGELSQGVPFYQALEATGSATITWSAASPPAGLSLASATGVLSGSPSATGSYSFAVTATNSAGSASRTFVGPITGTPPTITTTTLNSTYRGFPFTQALSVLGSTPVSFAVQSGSLPAGLTLATSTGVISGTPTSTGAYSVTVRATNAYGTGDKVIEGSITQSTPVISVTALSAMKIGTPFSQTLTATGGPTITWAVQSGSLPEGVSLNTSTGTISGTPTASGTYTVTIRATNGTEFADQSYTGSTGSAIAFSRAGAGYLWSQFQIYSPPPITVNTGETVLLFIWYSNQSNTREIGGMPTIGGRTMTQVGTTVSAGAGAGYYAYAGVYKLENFSGTSGSQPVTVPFTVAQVGLQYSTVCYTGGSGVASSFQSTALQTSSTVTQTVGSAAGRLIVQAFMKPWVLGSVSNYNQTTRFSSAPSTQLLLVGDAQGSASVDFTCTVTQASGAPNAALGLAVELLP
jgi:hypothetical protein